MKKIISSIAIIICLLIAFGVPVIIEWLYENFDNLPMDEIIFHLKVPMLGANTDIVKQGIEDCFWKIIIPTAIMSIILIYPMVRNVKIIHLIKTAEKRRTVFISIGIAILILIVSLSSILVTTDVGEYIKNQIDYKPNADKLLHILKDMGYILALATTTTNIQLNAYRNFNWNIKEKANIDEMFEIILSKEDVKDKKPSPEVHNKIMQVLNVSPSECLIIEDSLIGVQAAKNAGIEVAVIYDKYSDCNREEINKIAQYQFKDFDEMLNYIKNELGD